MMRRTVGKLILICMFVSACTAVTMASWCGGQRAWTYFAFSNSLLCFMMLAHTMKLRENNVWD